MALGPNEIKTAIIMCKRASCSGEESLAVAQTILALEEAFEQMTTPPEKEPKKEPAKKVAKKTRGK